VDLTVAYGETVAVNEVSLDFPTNEVTALIGPSGCGKSTLLRALNRLHDLDRAAHVTGRVELAGEDVLGPEFDPVDLRRRVGMVFQKPNPFPKSVFDNVAYGLRLEGVKKRDDLAPRVEHALREAALWDEVADRLDSPALGLSGGQQQRLCIARAIAVKPDVLLLDEPTSALDPISTEKVEDLIRALKARLTVVIVTHNMQQARRIADRVAVLYLGDLLEAGPTEKIFEHPEHDRTERYVRGRFG
jgi:phosphate transport system ATP-binding protein